MDAVTYILKKFNKENYTGEMPITVECLRRGIPEIFRELGLNTGVEIGVAGGRFSETLMMHHPEVKLYCVDPYKAYDEYFDYVRQDRISDFKISADERLKRFEGRFEFIIKPSQEAVKDFADESLDFVYVDGNHIFKYVVDDIYEWSKKVKKGGIISGHDYDFCKRPAIIHVNEVVNAYTVAYDIKPWFVTKSMPEISNRHGDVTRSFFWVKG